jgi:hypothetical protein
VDSIDVAIMASVFEPFAWFGIPPYPDWPPPCVDANEDGTITGEDYDCISTYFQQCSTCSDSLPQGFAADLEICNDGHDNDCDGQEDREGYNEELGFDGFSPSDHTMKNLCSCIEETPCEMLRSIVSGTTPITSEAQTQRCVSLNGGARQWYNQNDWACNSARSQPASAWTLDCAGMDGTTKSYLCTSLGQGAYAWVNRADSTDIFPPQIP